MIYEKIVESAEILVKIMILPIFVSAIMTEVNSLPEKEKVKKENKKIISKPSNII